MLLDPLVIQELLEILDRRVKQETKERKDQLEMLAQQVKISSDLHKDVLLV